MKLFTIPSKHKNTIKDFICIGGVLSRKPGVQMFEIFFPKKKKIFFLYLKIFYSTR